MIEYIRKFGGFQNFASQIDKTVPSSLISALGKNGKSNSDKVPLTNQQAFLSLYHAIHERSTKMFAGRTVRGVGNGHIGIDCSDQFVGGGS